MLTKALFLIGLVHVTLTIAKPSTSSRTYTVGEKVNDVFTFIGSAKSSGIGTQAQESLYFQSEATIAWADAQNMCFNVLGYDASVINIETPEEHEHIARFLKQANSPLKSYWTGGQYMTAAGQFIWPGPGGIVIDDTFPWGADQPSLRERGAKVLNVLEDNQANWSYNSTMQDEMHGFICELMPGSSSIPQPCYITNDLIMSLDSSGSVGAANYEEAKQKFVKVLAIPWNQWNDTKLSLHIYSTDVRVQFSLASKLGDFDMAKKIDDAPYIAGGTNSHLALDKARTDFTTWDRPVQRNVVFMTDGQSNEPEKTRIAAAMLWDLPGVSVYAVGIGSGINNAELLTIAGNNQRRVFTAPNFEELKNLLKPLSLVMCDEGWDE